MLPKHPETEIAMTLIYKLIVNYTFPEIGPQSLALSSWLTNNGFFVYNAHACVYVCEDSRYNMVAPEKEWEIITSKADL